MYFKDRAEAGQKLSEKLQQYRYENCVVIALSDGGVVVGEQIATDLHCILTMLLTEEISIPGEQSQFGTVDQSGKFVYNHMFSTGEYEGYYSEYHGYLEDQKREKFQLINRLLGDGGILDNDMLRDHTIVLVSDGLANGASLEAAVEFLKSVRTTRIIVATPIASVSAVDRMHVLSDEIHVLSVVDNFLSVEHYYDDNELPSHEETVQRINQSILNWR